MDISLIPARRRLFETLSATMAQVRKRHSKTQSNPETLKIAKGVVMMAVALIFGWIAKASTENQTRVQVLQGEWPAPAILTGILQQGGWSPVSMADRVTLFNRIQPSMNEKKGIWVAEQQCLVFIQQSSPGLWTCNPSVHIPKKKLEWKFIGMGYDGVNQLAEIHPPKLKKAASYIDPNEIRY